MLLLWFLNPIQEFINKGPLVEAFVGQELLGYSSTHFAARLYYWQRQARASQLVLCRASQNLMLLAQD
jgi:hypothetical protein